MCPSTRWPPRIPRARPLPPSHGDTSGRHQEGQPPWSHGPLSESSSHTHVPNLPKVLFKTLFFYRVTLQMTDKIKIAKWTKKIEKALQWSVKKIVKILVMLETYKNKQKA